MIVQKIDIDCTHCGLPVPRGLLVDDRSEQFCCQGCHGAWTLIHANGLESFYRMLESDPDNQSTFQRPLQPSEPNLFIEFDRDSFHEQFTDLVGESERKVTLALEGIHCAACVWLVEKLPMIVPGTVEAKVNWSQRTVSIVWQPKRIPLSKIAQTLLQLGYEPYPIRKADVDRRREAENRRQIVQIGIAAAAAGNNMLIAAALYFGMFSFMSTGIETMFRYASCLVGLVSFFGPGRAFLRGAWSAIVTRTPHMDLPVAIGLSAGVLAGSINTIRGVGEIYFDSLSVLICLLLIGRWIQFRQQNRAADAIQLLHRLTPAKARRLSNGIVTEVSIDLVEKGDILEVRPGDMFAGDGVISQGKTTVDESVLTGEARPVSKSPGETVAAGTRNFDSLVYMEVGAIGREMRITRIIDLVEEASTNKPRIVQWADRIAGYFVTIVLLLAVGTFLTWINLRPESAVNNTVALLIVACPCALAMATPLAIAVALGRLAQRKILVKTGDVVPSLCRPGIAWLDKTGTLTEGKLRVVKWYGEQKLVSLVASVESKFDHPIAMALTEYATLKGESNNLEVTESRILDGGVSASVETSHVLVGNRALMESNHIETKDWRAKEHDILANHESPCWVSKDGEIVGLIALGDTIRPQSKLVIDELKRLGWSIGILSGDHSVVVETVAQDLGIDRFHAGVTPEKKLEIILESNKSFETTVMVGDGVNDSAALAAATVGIAVHNGAESSLAAAPVYLASPGLESIRDLMRSSQSTRRTIYINFFASLGYNLLGVGLAMFGLLNPLVAAILMPFSSLTVVSLSLTAARKSI